MKKIFHIINLYCATRREQFALEKLAPNPAKILPMINIDKCGARHTRSQPRLQMTHDICIVFLGPYFPPR